MTAPEAPGPVDRRNLLVLACAGAVISTVGIQALAPALPVIKDSFGLSDAEVGAFIAVYLVPGVILAFPLGVLGDVVGRRVVFSGAAALYAVTGALGAATTQYGQLLVLRFVQGIGFAAVMPMTITILGDSFVGPALLVAQSRRAVSLVLGEFALPVVGATSARFGWRVPLLLNVAMLPIAVGGLLLLRPRRLAPPSRLAYGTLLGQSLRQPGIRLVMTLGALRFLFKFAMITYLPLLLVTKYGLPLFLAGIVVGLSAACAAVTASLVTIILRRFRGSRVAGVALGAIAVSLGMLAVLSSWPLAFAGAMMFGAADGVISIIQDAFVMQRVDAGARAGVVAMSGTAKNVGKLAAPLVMGALLVSLSIGTSLLVLSGIAVVAAAVMVRQSTLDTVTAQPATVPERGGGMLMIETD